MRKDFKRSFLIDLGISLGIVAVILIANYFVFSDISSRVSRIQELRRDTAFRVRAIDSLVVLKDESRRAAEYYNVLFNILPDTDSLFDFRRRLIALASDFGVKFTFAFGNDSPGTDLTPGFAEFDANISGEEKNFIPLLKKIEEGLYFIQFNSVDFDFANDKFNASMEGRIFSR